MIEFRKAARISCLRARLARSPTEPHAASLDQVVARAGDLPGGLLRLRELLRRGLEETAALFPAVRESYKWVKLAAQILKNERGQPAKKVRLRLVQLLARM